MNKTSIRKILGDVRTRRGRTFFVVAAIFVGVASTITFFSMRNLLMGQLQEDVKANELAMLNIQVSAAEAHPPDETLQTLVGFPDLTEMVGVVMGTVPFKLHETDTTVTEGYLEAVTTPYDQALPIEPPRLVEGRYPIAGKSELAIEQRMADKYGLAIGDSLWVQVQSESHTTGAVGTFEGWAITGIVFDPYVGITSPEEPVEIEVSATESFYGHIADANYLTGTTGLTFIQARFVNFSTAEEDMEQFARFIVEETPYKVLSISTNDPANSELIERPKTITDVMSYLALASLVVSGFLVTNVIGAIVIEQKRQIASLKVIGASAGDNFLIYAGIAATYGVLGVIGGVGVGVPAGYFAADALAPQVGTVLDSGFQWSPSAVLMGVGTGLLVPVVASILPVLFGIRVSILKAMNDIGIDTRYGNGPTAKILAILPIPIAVRQGLSSLAIKKVRLALTIITLVISVGTFMSIHALFSRVINALNVVSEMNNFQITLSPKEVLPSDQMMNALQSNFADGEQPLLASIEPAVQVGVNLEGYETQTFGPPGVGVPAHGYATDSPTPAYNLTLTDGAFIHEATVADGVIISSTLAENANKRVGDRITIVSLGQKTDLQVVGIVDYPLEQLWLDWRTLALAVGYTQNGAPQPQSYYLRLAAPNPTAQDVDTAMQTISATMLTAETPVITFNNLAEVEDIQGNFQIFQWLLEAAAGLIALVGALGLLITLSMSVFERQKEIGIMRSIGAGSSTIAIQFLTEGVGVGVLAWVGGIPLAIIAYRGLLDIAGFANIFSATLPTLSALYGFFGILVVVFLASVLPSISAARKTVADIVRYQ